jgi:predicted amidohydrolase
MQPELLDLAGNLARVIDHSHRAAAREARLVVFPEIALSGYVVTPDEADALAQPVPGPATHAVAQACAQDDIHVVLGMLECDADGTLFNTAVLLGPTGLLARYRKTHLPLLGVDRYLAAGDGFTSPVVTPAGRVGLCICYDLRFPEPRRVLALLRAQVIALSTAWPAGRFHRNSSPEVAAENRVTWAANRCGETRHALPGAQRDVAPMVKVLAGATRSEETLYAEIDPAASDVKRLIFAAGEYELDVWGDRRPDLYGPIAREA